jgi:cell shape-determining protein MreC
MPPGVSGRVTAVNKNWNFVVLNVGQKQNVVEGGELIVYRGQKMIGKVKVVSVESNSSVADILPEWAQSDLQTGDEVIN